MVLVHAKQDHNRSELLELLQEYLNNRSVRVPTGSRFDRHDALLAAVAPPLQAERTAGTSGSTAYPPIASVVVGQSILKLRARERNRSCGTALRAKADRQDH